MILKTQFYSRLNFSTAKSWKTSRRGPLLVVLAVNSKGQERQVMIARSLDQAKSAVKWLRARAGEDTDGTSVVDVRDAIAAARKAGKIAA